MLKQLKAGLVIAILAFVFIFFISRGITEKSDWSVDADGLLSYPDRVKLEPIRRLMMEENSEFTMEKVIYKSRSKEIYGLLFLPKGREDVTGIIMLPGANGAKENHLNLGKKMAAAGYAFLTIDQRGIGETAGSIPSMEDDFNAYFSNEEPVQHLMVYDVLRAFDVFSKIDPVDEVIVAGESMGARFAIIAAALETGIKGCVAFSTSGFGLHDVVSAQQKFMASINPDFYVERIAPRKLVMFHSEKDSVVPYAQAQATFSLAKEPKELVLMGEPCDHGYCDAVYEEFLAEIGIIAQQ